MEVVEEGEAAAIEFVWGNRKAVWVGALINAVSIGASQRRTVRITFFNTRMQ